MMKENKDTTISSNDKKIPEYKILEKILINKNLLKNLIKYSNNSTGSVEGYLFGHEEENNITIENCFPILNTGNEETFNIVEYMKLNRMDFIQVGYFICKEYSEFLKKKTFKKYFDFQLKFPNAVFIFFDYSLYINGDYPFSCFRISKNLIEMLDKMDIEEDQMDITKKFFASEDLFKNLNFTLIEDELSLFTSAVSSNYDYSENIHEKEIGNLYKNDCYNYLSIRINELNKTSEGLIDEQKKYINYYKIKRQFGKTKESEFLELLNKKGSELANLEKIDMSIMSKNILDMNERVKSVIDHINIKNVFNLEI